MHINIKFKARARIPLGLGSREMARGDIWLLIFLFLLLACLRMFLWIVVCMFFICLCAWLLDCE